MIDVGIVAAGAYVPTLRIDREEIVAAHRWLEPNRIGRGTRAACTWDEDTITMAVEASRDCGQSFDLTSVTSAYLGTTTAPFADRLNSSIITGALGLPETARAFDVTGSLRAGTSALLAAIDASANGGMHSLCVASDRRAAAAATAQEMAFGHAAAAVVVGPGPGIARLLGQRSLTVDFVDHYRAASEQFDYVWEDRWIRDEGYLNLTTRLIDDLLAGAGIRPDELTHFCLPVSLRNVDRAVAAKCGIPETAVRDQLADGCGNSGAAHPLLMLVDALADARAGDRILIIGFAQGGDALLFEVTEEIDRFRASGGGVRKWLERSSPCSYPRYLVLSGLLQVARGMRAEVDKGTGLSAAYRHRDFLLNLVGGRCAACGTYQIPRTTICVNPDCGVADQQSAYSFAESLGRVASWSADHLTAIPDPPAYYGMVDFAEGGRLLMDFVEAGGGVDIGTEMRMVFRVKDYDPVRKYRRYFWKATPIRRRETDVG